MRRQHGGQNEGAGRIDMTQRTIWPVLTVSTLAQEEKELNRRNMCRSDGEAVGKWCITNMNWVVGTGSGRRQVSLAAHQSPATFRFSVPPFPPHYIPFPPFPSIVRSRESTSNWH